MTTKLVSFELTYIQHRFSGVIRELFEFCRFPGINHVQLCELQSAGYLFLRTIPQPTSMRTQVEFILCCGYLALSSTWDKLFICIQSCKPPHSNTTSWIGLVMCYCFGNPNTNSPIQTIEETVHIGHRWY